MNQHTTVKPDTATPALLIEARHKLANLEAVAASDSVYRRRAADLARRLANVIEHAEGDELPILHGHSPHLSSLNYWLLDYKHAINAVLGDTPTGRAAESYVPAGAA